MSFLTVAKRAIVPAALIVTLAAGAAGCAAPENETAAPAKAAAPENETAAPAKAATPSHEPGYVTRAMFGATWPLTVPTGTIACERSSGDGVGLVTFTSDDGTTYAVNGLALGWADEFGWRDVDEIWAWDETLNPDHDPDGARVNIGPIIDRGLALCDDPSGATIEPVPPPATTAEPVETEPVETEPVETIEQLPADLKTKYLKVGIDIQPGSYRMEADPRGDGCDWGVAWATGRPADTMPSTGVVYPGEAPATMTIEPIDEEVAISGCLPLEAVR